MNNQCIQSSDSVNHIYLFEIWEYGNKIGCREFKDFKSAQQYYCNSYFNYNYALLPFVDDKQLTFNEAYEYFGLRRYLTYNFGRKK